MAHITPSGRRGDGTQCILPSSRDTSWLIVFKNFRQLPDATLALTGGRRHLGAHIAPLDAPTEEQHNNTSLFFALGDLLVQALATTPSL